MPETKAKRNYTSRKALNPRRCQSLLKRVSETMLADSRNPTLTHQERLAYLELGTKYSQILASVEGRRRTAQRAAAKKLGPLDSYSPF
jgi:hypothetical protein